jgi:SOS response regulatory protein OraA/RecX
MAPPIPEAELILRAKISREAIVAAFENDESAEVRRAARTIAKHASRVSLARLPRLLK